MFSSLGLTVADVAKFLQVSPRTVQLWVSGRVRIPLRGEVFASLAPICT